MKKYGKEINSINAWDQLAKDYSDKLLNTYHKHRLAVIDSLIPKSLYKSGINILDFGCGDAIHFEQFSREGVTINGLDVSENIIDLAKQRLVGLNLSPELVKIGGVDKLLNIKSNSLDAIISFNVLAYLTDDEDALFYNEAFRILRPGGLLIVTHSNELFDMFSMNQYTINFMKKHLISDEKYQNLLSFLFNYSFKEESTVTYNIRENPLSYKFKLEKFGFSEKNQEFINLHQAPPILLGNDKPYPDTLIFKPEDKWKLMFTCSTFGSLSIRNYE